jgi:hypothetical protein
MSRSKISVKTDAAMARGPWLDDVTRSVRAAVRSERSRGQKIGDAIQQAGLALGLTPRRTRALLYGEVFAVAAEEYRHFSARLLAYLDREADQLEIRAEALRLQRQQMQLDLETAWSNSSASGSASSGHDAPGVEQKIAAAEEAQAKVRELRTEIARDKLKGRR